MMQPLTEWDGDVESLLNEMKRRAGAETDTELATIMSTSQSNVSTWRKRGSVPRAALLRFERLNLQGSVHPAHRAIAARMLAIRVAEYSHHKAQKDNLIAARWMSYSRFAFSWNLIVKAIGDDLANKERETRLFPLDLAARLIENENYLNGLATWVNGLSSADVIGDLGGEVFKPDA